MSPHDCDLLPLALQHETNRDTGEPDGSGSPDENILVGLSPSSSIWFKSNLLFVSLSHRNNQTMPRSFRCLLLLLSCCLDVPLCV